ncbi:MAG: hypothetical protein NC048_04110 [Bacteroides sp.]|nr:hypothetical protein [Ruminococcus flavefaciens]MCM1554660.1 hypothetical protein [Bacteroides sp.]
MNGLYINIWNNHLNDLLEIIRKEQGTVSLDSSRFKEVGNRQKSGYSFRLNISDGIIPKKTGSAVARDLKKVLDESVEFQKVAQGKNIIIRLDTSFNLIVETI